MLRGGCDGLVGVGGDLLVEGWVEQLTAELLELTDRAGVMTTPRQPRLVCVPRMSSGPNQLDFR